MKLGVKYVLWVTVALIAVFGIYKAVFRLGWLDFLKPAGEEPAAEALRPLIFSITSRIKSIRGTTIFLEAPPGEEAPQILVTNETRIVELKSPAQPLGRDTPPVASEVEIKLAALKVGDVVAAEVIRTSAEQTTFEAVKIQKLPAP